MTEMFFICARNLDEYFPKFIPSKIFSMFHFLQYSYGQKFKMKGILK